MRTGKERNRKLLQRIKQGNTMKTLAPRQMDLNSVVKKKMRPQKKKGEQSTGGKRERSAWGGGYLTSKRARTVRKKGRGESRGTRSNRNRRKKGGGENYFPEERGEFSDGALSLWWGFVLKKGLIGKEKKLKTLECILRGGGKIGEGEKGSLKFFVPKRGQRRRIRKGPLEGWRGTGALLACTLKRGCLEESGRTKVRATETTAMFSRNRERR